MPIGPERQLVRDLAQAVSRSFLEDELILGGSSGLFGFATAARAFTEDPEFQDRGAEGYRSLLEKAERGFEVLRGLVGGPDDV